MALVLADRVRETSTTASTGTLTLSGAVANFQSFSAIGNSNTTYYTIVNRSASEWEVGIGTYTASGTTLSRDTVLSSSNSNSLVNFSAGTKDVWGDYPAGKAVTTDTLAYPPAIGGTTAAAGTFTTLIGGSGSANYEQITGGATGKAVQFQSLGTDTNVAYAIQSKGTGAIDLAAGSSGVNISNGGTVTAITGTSAGSGYTSFPTPTVSAPTTAGGVQAVVAVTRMFNSGATIQAGGTGYTVNDVLTVTGGTPFSVAATLTVSTVSAGVITGVSATNQSTYTALPTNPVSVTGGTGSGATFNLTWGVNNGSAGYNITNAGSGYVEQPTVTFSGGGGSGAAAYATVGGNATIKGLGTNTIFNTPSGNALYLVDGASATPSGIAIRNGTTPYIYPVVSNTDLITSSNGTGAVRFFTNTVAQEQLRVTHTASAVNYVQVTGAATGGAPTISSQGSDANPNVAIFPKGLGIVLMNQQTPTAVTATGTLTIANLLTQIVTSTSATAVSLTLPTGTLSDAGVSGGTSAVNTSFDWAIINLGSAIGDVTLVAGTAHTIVGSVTVAVGTSGKFRSRKTATNTFVTYRV